MPKPFFLPTTPCRHLVLHACVLFWLFVVATAHPTAAQPPVFHHLPIENGPLSSSVLAITQDGEGYIWFGVRDGLIRYDGVRFRKFESRRGAKDTLSVFYISNLLADSRKNIWVGASDGLMRYNRTSGIFEAINIHNTRPYFVNALLEDRKGRVWIGVGGGLHLLKDPATLSFTTFSVRDGLAGERVLALREDREGHIWVGTENGLSRITEQNGQFSIRSFRSGAAAGTTVHANYITSLAVDFANRLWIGTQHDGISLYNPATGSFTPIKHDGRNPNGLVNNNVRKILCTRQGKIWVGTQEGVSIIDPQTMQVSNYQNEPGNEQTLSQNSVHSLFEDKNGTVWIGTYYGGVNKVYTNKTKFNVWRSTGGNNSLSTNVISSIVEDRQGNLWIGTEGGGLNSYNRQTKTFSTFKNRLGDPFSIGSNLVKIVFIDRDQNIWAGTHGGGLNVKEQGSGRFLRYLLNEKDPASLSSEILSIAEDPQHRLWVATNNGLKLFKRNGLRLEPLDVKTVGNNLLDLTVQSVFCDSRGDIWFRANQGLYRLRLGKLELIDNSSFFTAINEDSKGNIWAGLNYGNLIRWDAQTGQVSRYTDKEGLPVNYMLSVVPEPNGTLWLGTDKGLLHYNPANATLRRYTTSDGLAANEFNYHAYLSARNGQLYFGGFNGITYFSPDSIEANPTVAPLVFTSLKLYNKEVVPGDKDGLLSADIGMIQSLSFDHDQSAFTLEFALLNFIKSEKNRYAYKLEGIDRAWNETTTPSATYLKLPPGSYTFLVKGANNDGVWSQPASMQITIRPPFWQTWWAYLLYLLLGVAILFFVTRFLFMRALLKKEDALHQVKLNFFTNISHEIRTHLTLIMAPVDQMLYTQNQDDYSAGQLNKVKKNANRLLRLVNELMDFRKAETDNLKLVVGRNNMVPFLLDIYANFEDLSVEKNIQTALIHHSEDVPVYFDPLQMEKVFFNLLSNAFKFTPNGGKILVRLDQTDDAVHVAITNNGKGIAPEFIDKLFTNFFQVPDDKQNTGYGIGLALAKNIVALHGGTIEVSSRAAAGDTEGQTTFLVQLRKGNAHFRESDLVQQPAHNAEPAHTSSQELPPAPSTEATAVMTATSMDHTILIVEDNTEIRTILRQTFNTQYNILEATQGMEGWQLASGQLPDLIISDVMMPQMDGFALCTKLKTDERTSHIPVILLTAKSSQTDQLSGMETGADVYLTKPFNPRILALNARNLLASREKVRRKFSRDLAVAPSELMPTATLIASQPYNGIDREFLQKVTDLIQENFENAEFGVEMLSRKVAMSPPILYKKIKAVTNMSVNEFIKSLRLKRAAELLLQKELTIYQVAYTVGYEDRKYFSKEFKKQYGVNPSEYAATVNRTASQMDQYGHRLTGNGS